MSKERTKSLTVKTATSVSLLLLCMSPGLSDTSAKETVQTKAPTYIASYEPIPSDQLDFDGQGTLDAINPFQDANTKEKGNTLASAMVIISGQQFQFASDVEVFDERSHPLPVELLNIGDYVGFRKDPSDKIFRLWKVKTPAVTTNAQAEQTPQIEKTPAPRNDSPMRFVDGVWKN